MDQSRYVFESKILPPRKNITLNDELQRRESINVFLDQDNTESHYNATICKLCQRQMIGSMKEKLPQLMKIVSSYEKCYHQLLSEKPPASENVIVEQNNTADIDQDIQYFSCDEDESDYSQFYEPEDQSSGNNSRLGKSIMSTEKNIALIEQEIAILEKELQDEGDDDKDEFRINIYKTSVNDIESLMGTINLLAFDIDYTREKLSGKLRQLQALDNELLFIQRNKDQLYPLFDKIEFSPSGEYIVVNKHKLSCAAMAKQQLSHREMNAAFSSLASILLLLLNKYQLNSYYLEHSDNLVIFSDSGLTLTNMKQQTTLVIANHHLPSPSTTAHHNNHTHSATKKKHQSLTSVRATALFERVLFAVSVHRHEQNSNKLRTAKVVLESGFSLPQMFHQGVMLLVISFLMTRLQVANRESLSVDAFTALSHLLEACCYNKLLLKMVFSILLNNEVEDFFCNVVHCERNVDQEIDQFDVAAELSVKYDALLNTNYRDFIEQSSDTSTSKSKKLQLSNGEVLTIMHDVLQPDEQPQRNIFEEILLANDATLLFDLLVVVLKTFSELI